MFSLLPRCQGERGSQKYLGRRRGDGSRVPPVGQVRQHHEPGRPVHQGPDRGLVVFADDQVASLCPGTARSATSAGRSEMLTMSRSRPAGRSRRAWAWKSSTSLSEVCRGDPFRSSPACTTRFQGCVGGQFRRLRPCRGRSAAAGHCGPIAPDGPVLRPAPATSSKPTCRSLAARDLRRSGRRSLPARPGSTGPGQAGGVRFRSPHQPAGTTGPRCSPPPPTGPAPRATAAPTAATTGTSASDTPDARTP